MRPLTQQEIDQAPDWATKYDVSHHAANRLVGYYGECQAQFVYTKSDMWSDVHCNYAAPDYALPIPRKEFDIGEHEFSDPNFDGCEIDGQDVILHVSTHSDLNDPTSIAHNEQDSIALAKHFGHYKET